MTSACKSVEGCASLSSLLLVLCAEHLVYVTRQPLIVHVHLYKVTTLLTAG